MKKFLNRYKDEVWLAVILFLIFNAMGFFIGVIEGQEEIMKGRTGCSYESFASFFPGRVLACELFRNRFSVEEKK